MHDLLWRPAVKRWYSEVSRRAPKTPGPVWFVRRGAMAMKACLIAVVGSLVAAGSVAASDGPTYYKNVAPILQANCQSCHRPGEVAPMSLLTYESSRPYAQAIKNAVVKRQMPPWFADP